MPELQKILNDEDRKADWKRAVFGLGAIPNAKAALKLREFLENRFSGEIDDETFQAICYVPFSMAFACRAYKSEDLKDYILNATNPDFWEAKKIGWRYKDLKEANLNIFMAQLYIKSSILLNKHDNLRNDIMSKIKADRGARSEIIRQALQKVELFGKPDDEKQLANPLGICTYMFSKQSGDSGVWDTPY
ncbi:MAG: hypothetical protein M5R36_28895 [Deltaproteobacteria bacterium]|nr:hypothetical protein [Deltaproteobacteria bacterium]